MKKLAKFILYTLLILIVVLLVFTLSLRSQKVQNALVREFATWFSEKTNTDLVIGHVAFKFFTKFDLQDITLLDADQDTIAHVGTVRVSAIDLLKPSRIIDDVYIRDVDAHLSTSREDGSLNISSIIDAFAKEDTTTKKDKAPIHLDLKKIKIEDVNIDYADLWRGQAYYLSCGKINVDAQKIDLNSNDYSIKSAILDRPYFRLSYFPKSPNYQPVIKSVEEIESDVPDTSKAPHILVEKLKLDKGHFHLLRENEPPPTAMKFNSNDINLNEITVYADNVKANEEGIFAKISNLAARDKSGIAIKKMSTDLFMGSEQTNFMEADIQLNKSNLAGDLKFIYGDPSNMSDFINKVVMDIKLKNSIIATDDVAYFSNQLSTWNVNTSASLDFLGTISDFKAKINNLITKRGTQFSGTIAMKGLPDIEKTDMQIHSEKLYTNLKTVGSIVPQLLEIEAVDFDKLGMVHFIGDFKGKYLNFLINGELGTENGELQLNKFGLDMMRAGDPIYFGDVDFRNINLEGFLVGFPSIKGHGHVDFDAVGFDIEKMYIDLVSKLEYVTYDDMELKGVDLNGRVTARGLNAMVNSADKKFNGKFDLGFDIQDRNHLILDGDFKTVDIYALGFSDVPFSVQGMLNADMKGDYEQNLLGKIILQDAVFKYQDSVLSEELLEITADNKNGLQDYQVSTPEFIASVNGLFEINEILPLFQTALHRYLPAYTALPSMRIGPDKYVQFTLDGNRIQKYLDIFMPIMQIGDSVDLSAYLSLDRVDLDGVIPSFAYDSYLLKDLVLDINGLNKKLSNMVTVAEFYNGEEQLFHGIDLRALAENDKIDIKLTTNDRSENVNLLQTIIQADNDTFKFHLLPSAVYVNNREWKLQSEGLTYLHDRYLDVAKTTLDNGLGRFLIQSQKGLFDSYPDLEVVLEEFDIANILDFADTDLPDIKSMASGKVRVEDPMGPDLALQNNLKLEKFTIENQSLGDVRLDAKYKLSENIIHLLNTSGLDNNDTWVKFFGDIGLDSTGNLDLAAEAHDYDIAPFQPFVNEFLTGLKGDLDGRLDITGTFEDYSILGAMNLLETEFKLVTTGVKYQLPRVNLKLEDQLFEIDTTHIYDDDKNVAKLTGLIVHNGFSDFNFLVNLWSDKFKVLDNSAESSPELYGKVVTKLSALVQGKLTDLGVSLDISPVEESMVTLVASESDQGGALEGIEFRGIADMFDTLLTAVDSNKINLEVYATLSPLLHVNYIISQVDNSSISVEGNGNISLYYPMGFNSENEPMTVFGGYEVTEGAIRYLNSNNFELTQIAGVQIFNIKDSTSILLNGNPLNAIVNGGAYSTIPVSNLEGMFSAEERNDIQRISQSTYSDIYKSQDVLVNVDLNNATLDDVQNISYRISLPEVANKNSEIYAKLDAINSNQNEAQKQVMSLLLLNSFLSEDNMNTRMVFNTAIGNTANIFTSRISNTLNQSIKNITNMDNLDVGVGLRFDNDSSSLLNEQSLIPVVNFNGKVRLLDDRLVLKVGYDINMANYSSQSAYSGDNVITGDYKLEYSLDQGQDLDAYIYRSSSYDPLVSTNGKINRSGVGLSYNVSFNSLSDLARRKDEEEDEKEKKKKR